MIDMWTDDALPALHFYISQLLSRYARGVDRRDWNLLRSCFHEDAVDEHGLSSGNVSQFIESFAMRSGKIPEMMHPNSNILILERDHERREVLVETYCVAWSRVLPGEMIPGSFYDTSLIAKESPYARVATIANRYLDLISERDGDLRFQFRRVIFEWVSVSEVEVDRPFGPGLSTSTRTPEDPSFRTLSDFRAEYLTRRAQVHSTLSTS
jgi:SnoaL-like domain